MLSDWIYSTYKSMLQTDAISTKIMYILKIMYIMNQFLYISYYILYLKLQ